MNMGKRVTFTIRTTFCLLAAVFLAAFVFAAPMSASAEPPEIDSAEKLLAAISDESVSELRLSDGSFIITTKVEIKRSIKLTGSSATILDFADGAYFDVASGVSMTLAKVQIKNVTGSSVVSKGSVILGSGVSLFGNYGIKLESGSSLSAGGQSVSISESLVRAVWVNTAGGTVKISDLIIAQAAGQSIPIYIEPGAGELILGGSVSITSPAANAIVCPAGGECPKLSAEANASITVNAPEAVNPSGGDYLGAAIDIRSGAFVAGASVTLNLRGSYSCLLAKSIELGAKCNASLSCAKTSAKNDVAALCGTDSIRVLENGAITIGASSDNKGNGLYSTGAVSLGSGCQLIYRGGAAQYGAVISGGAFTLGAGGSIALRGAQYGVRCGSFSCAEKCTIDISEMTADGIRAVGAVEFGANATATIHADSSAIYSETSAAIKSGGVIALKTKAAAPALFIESKNGTAGGLSISGSKLEAANAATAGAKQNSCVFVTGTLTLDSAAKVTVINEKDFGITVANGDVKISGGAALNCSGGCGLYLSRGSVNLTSGGELFAEGVSDSAIRLESGSVSVADSSVIDACGARFGLELLGTGNVQIGGAKSFDIRSTKDRAVYINNGNLSIDNVPRLSAWSRDEENKNESLWWADSVEYDHSWECSAINDADRLVADHTAISPALKQDYASGTALPQTGFKWYDGDFSVSGYSRLAAFKSRPNGRSNSFNIPAGKSFSWQLYGESYDDIKSFELLDSSGDGQFLLDESGKFTYESLSYSRGIQTFDFVVYNSDNVASLPATISILVTASKPPIAYSATFLAPPVQKFIGQLNMFDYDGAVADTKITSQPQHGEVILSSDGKFSYEPGTGFTGLDSFTYVAIDNMGDESNPGFVTIAVGMEEELLAYNQTIITESGVEASARLVAQIGEDKTDGATYTYAVTVEPTYGTLVLDDEGMIIYQPYQDFAGNDLFKITAAAADGTVSNEAIVTVATIPSQRPTAETMQFFCVRNSSCVEKLVANDVDGSITEYRLLSQPENGVITLNSLTGEFELKPDSGFTGSIQFTYCAVDSDGLISDEAVVTLQVSSLIDNLRNTGRLGAAIFLFCAGILAIIAVLVIIIVSASRKKKEKLLEEEKRRLFDYSLPEEND